MRFMYLTQNGRDVNLFQGWCRMVKTRFGEGRKIGMEHGGRRYGTGWRFLPENSPLQSR